MVPFLERCPVAAAIKTRDRELLWCNREYELLTERTLPEIKGRQTQAIFSLTDLDQLIQNEHTVLLTNRWM